MIPGRMERDLMISVGIERGLYSGIQLDGIDTFCLLGYFWGWRYWHILGSKITQEKLLKFTKVLNYIKSLCIIFCVKMTKYSQYIYYSQKELKHFRVEIIVVYGVLQHL